MKLILLRHGESQWNLENRFTGWTDVPLTKNGIKEAEFAASAIIKEQIKIVSLYTSVLKRATDTAKIVANKIGFELEKINYDWRLNERHYGALQGLNKSETALKHGENQVLIWRRSYDISPPKLDIDDKRHPMFNNSFQNLEEDQPNGESLKNVVQRLKPFWDKYSRYILKQNENHLIVAHSNSLRAIVKILEELSDQEILFLNIPTGVPLLYEIDENKKIVNKKYLIEESLLKKKERNIIDQGKIST